MKVYIIWLIGVILWNFGVPNATPIGRNCSNHTVNPEYRAKKIY